MGTPPSFDRLRMTEERREICIKETFTQIQPKKAKMPTLVPSGEHPLGDRLGWGYCTYAKLSFVEGKEGDPFLTHCHLGSSNYF